MKKIVFDNPDVDFHFWGAYDNKDNNVSGGPNEMLINELRKIREQCSNAHFYGVKSAGDIIPELDKIDACIYINDSTKDVNGGANSHKILEYLCTGKVVISTHLSYYKHLGLFPMTEKAREQDYPAFFKNVLANLDSYNHPDQQRKRLNYTLQNRYVDNVGKILTFLGLKKSC